MKVLSAILFAVFVCVALFGLPMLLSHDGHHVGCPLEAVGEVMCESTILDHFSIWHAMFAGIASVLVLCVGCVASVTFRLGEVLAAHERIRLRFAFALPAQPTLMQKLYSRGIHNRKEPSCFS